MKLYLVSNTNKMSKWINHVRNKTPMVSVGYPWQSISNGVNRRGDKNCGRGNL